jgi:hypothetical protein
MNEWESNWAGFLAQETGSADVPFTTQVFLLWNKSTPLEPWTNNPLGMPRTTKYAFRVLSTEYGAFTSMKLFRSAFLQFLASTPGRSLRDALLLQDRLAPAWRAIHDLRWPAVLTETDYPSAIMDAIEAPVRARLKPTAPDQRTTSGLIGPATQPSPASESTAHQSAQQRADIASAAQAIRQLWR